VDDNQVQVVVTANLDALKQGMADAANSVRAGAEQMSESVSGLGEMFDSLHETVMGLIETFGAYEGLKFGVELVKSGAEMSEQLVVLSKQTGINLEDLSRLKFAAQSTGSDFSRLGTMIGTLDQKLLQLHSSTSTTITAGFQQLGIDPNKLKGTSDALDKISEALRRMGSTPQSIGALREILGRQGASDIPMLMELKELEEESDRLGGTLDGKTVEAAWHAQEAFNTLGAMWDAAKIRITAGLAPALNELIKNAQELVIEINTLSANGDLSRWAEESASNIKTLATDAVTVVKALEETNDWLNKINPFTAAGRAGGAVGGWLSQNMGVRWSNVAGRQGPSAETAAEEPQVKPLLAQVGTMAAGGKEAFQPWVENALEAAKAAAKLKQELEQNFAEAQAQSKLEAAAAGNTADAKVEAARRVFLAAQTFFGSGSKQADTAETSLYGAESARDKQNQAATGQGLIDTEKYGAGGEGDVAVERAKIQQSLELKQISPEEAASKEEAQDNAVYSLREALYAKLADLYQNDPKELARIHAEEEQEDAQHNAKMVEDATKIAVANKAAATSMADAWRGALEPLMSSFDSFFDLIVQGTNKAKGSAEQMRLEMEKLERSTLLDLAKSGMKGVMFGGKEGTTQGALFGGGIVGEASQLAMGTGGGAGGAGNGGILGWLLGPAAANSMMAAMRGTGGNSGGLLGWLFGTASSAIMGALGISAPGSQNAKSSTGPGAGSSVAAAGAQAATGMVTNAASGALSATEITVPIVSAITAMTLAMESSALGIVALLATANASLDMMAVELAELDITDMLILAKPSILGTTFAQGGIVSAAGGMVVGGARGTQFAILHDREMVLPRNLSEGVQNMIARGESSGGDLHVHTHIHAVDAKSFEERLDHHSNAIANGVVKAMRMQHPGLTHAIKTGHAGR
jgi:hypothetical protein